MFAPSFDAGVGVLGGDYAAEDEAIKDYEAVMHDEHRPVMEGNAYVPTRAEAALQYIHSQKFEVHFRQLESTFLQGGAAQIAIILAPEDEEVANPTQFMFRMYEDWYR